jgi:hypothetical protein
MLEAIGLSKSYYGAVVLDALDLIIEPDEVFCLLGANGAGTLVGRYADPDAFILCANGHLETYTVPGASRTNALRIPRRECPRTGLVHPGDAWLRPRIELDHSPSSLKHNSRPEHPLLGLGRTQSSLRTS